MSKGRSTKRRPRLSGGQAQPRQQTAEVLTFFECDRAAVDCRDVSDDRESEAGARLSGVEPGAARKQRLPFCFRDSLAVVLDLDSTVAPFGSTVTNTRPPPYFAAFSTRLPSISSRSWRSTRTTASWLPAMSTVTFSYIRSTARCTASRLPTPCPRLGGRASPDCPSASKMVINLAPHDDGLPAYGVGKVRRRAVAALVITVSGVFSA